MRIHLSVPKHDAVENAAWAHDAKQEDVVLGEVSLTGSMLRA